jgi:hypothetical protein
MSNLSDSAALRILIAGEGRSPIHEEAWQRGLQAAGCAVERFDWMPRFRSSSRLRSLYLRVQNHLLLGPTILALNADLAARVLTSSFDVLLLYRPTHVLPSTLRLIREKAPATLVVSYNNDDPFSAKAPAHLWRHYLDGIPLTDVALAYREKNLAELRAAGARRVHLIRSYYLPDVHHPVELTASDRERYVADVTFVGHYESDGRIDCLAAVAEAFPRFRLFGPDWERAPDHPALRRVRPTRALPQAEYVKAIQCAKLALVFFSGLNNDTYTRRVFEIPAIGTFMLCPRTAEMEGMFRPEIEADYFASPEELVAKIRHYLSAEVERQKIATAGAARVRSDGHDIYSRMRVLSSLLREWRQAI